MASDPAFTASFNSNPISTTAIYKDVKGFGTSNYPYGVYVYDVTSYFNTAGNTLTLTPEGTPGTTNDYLLWGAYLVVTYSDPATTEKQIRINDEFDMVSSSINHPTYKYSVNDAEATVYAPFTGIDISGVDNANVIAIVAESNPGGTSSDTGKSKFFFNSNEYTGFWADYISTAKIGFSVFDVTSALASGSNEARLQSYDSGTGGDNFYAMNTILVVEKTEGAVGITSLGASTTSGDAPLSVTFTPVTSGYIIGYAWDFDNDGDTDSTEAAPTYSYSTAGTYSVKLTVTGAGAGNTATKTETDYITVLEPAPIIDFTINPTSGVEPLLVAFDATNTGGAVTSWKWEYKLTGDTIWTEFATTEDASNSFTDGIYDIRLTAEGPDYTDVETKSAAVSVGAATISVTVSPSGIDFGTMQTGVDETGSTTVDVDVTGGNNWWVTASASNGGYMGTGTGNLANPFQLSNDGTNFQAMTSNFANFMNGAAGGD
jgi:PKD repeat protein